MSCSFATGRNLCLTLLAHLLIIQLFFLQQRSLFSSYKPDMPTRGVLGMAIVLHGSENGYFPEWIRYAMAQGATKVYIYDTTGWNSTKAMLEPFVEAGVVRHILHTGGRTQKEAYLDALKRSKRDVRWLGIMDVDEFLLLDPNVTSVPGVGPIHARTVAELLEQMERAEGAPIKGMEVPRINYGRAGWDGRPNQTALLAGDFTSEGEAALLDAAANETTGWTAAELAKVASVVAPPHNDSYSVVAAFRWREPHVTNHKSVVRTDLVRSDKISSVHHFWYKNVGRILNQRSQWGGRASRTLYSPNQTGLRINHYYVRSTEEAVSKCELWQTNGSFNANLTTGLRTPRKGETCTERVARANKGSFYNSQSAVLDDAAAMALLPRVDL